MNKQEILGRINACNNELEQMDYRGRKVAFEVAKKLEELFPNITLPIYEAYKDDEAIADARRAEINQLLQELEKAEDENDGKL